MVATAHREFADRNLFGSVNLVVDTRNVVRSDWVPRLIGA